MNRTTDEFRCDTNPDEDFLLVETESGFKEIWVSVNESGRGSMVMLSPETATRVAFSLLGGVNRLRKARTE